MIEVSKLGVGHSPSAFDLKTLEALVRTSSDSLKDISAYVAQTKRIWLEILGGYNVDFFLTDAEETLRQSQSVGNAGYWAERSATFQHFKNGHYYLDIDLSETESGKKLVFVVSTDIGVVPQKYDGPVHLIIENSMKVSKKIPMNRRGITGGIEPNILGVGPYKATLE